MGGKESNGRKERKGKLDDDDDVSIYLWKVAKCQV